VLRNFRNSRCLPTMCIRRIQRFRQWRRTCGRMRSPRLMSLGMGRRGIEMIRWVRMKGSMLMGRNGAV